MRTLRLPFISIIFQAHFDLTAGIGAREIKLYENLTIHPHMRPAAIACVKLQRQKYTERRTVVRRTIHTDKIRPSVGLTHAHPNKYLCANC